MLPVTSLNELLFMLVVFKFTQSIMVNDPGYALCKETQRQTHPFSSLSLVASNSCRCTCRKRPKIFLHFFAICLPLHLCNKSASPCEENPFQDDLPLLQTQIAHWRDDWLVAGHALLEMR